MNLEPGCFAIVTATALAGKVVQLDTLLQPRENLPFPLHGYYVKDEMWYVWFKGDKVAGVVFPHHLLRIDGSYELTDMDRIDFYRENDEW